MYTAVVLTQESQNKLKAFMKDLVPVTWQLYCHHMTINMGKANQGPANAYLGQTVQLVVNKIGRDNRVIALGVQCDIPSNNAIKHITVAVNLDIGGKPRHSNDLTEWNKLPTLLTLEGVVMEVA